MNTKVTIDKPQVSKDLISYLKTTFPITRSLEISTEQELHKFQGMHEVIKHLEHLSTS